MSLGSRIINLRKKYGWERQELADKSKLTYTALSKYETDVREPDGTTLKLLATILNTTTDYLLEDNKVAESPGEYKVDPNPPDIWQDLDDKERKEAEDFMRWLKSKRGIKDENSAASGQ